MKAAQLKDLLRMLRAARPARVINYLELFFSYLFSLIIRKPVRKGMPAFVTVEPTNYCNLQCSECPTGSGKLTRPAGNISIEKYLRIIDEISGSVMYLTLYFQGEPYLHPDLFRMIKADKQKKLYVATATNAQFLNPEMAEKTILSGLDRIVISFDGPDEETYQTYRKKGSWENVMQGVQDLVETRKRLKSSTPFIILQCLLIKSNENRQNQVRKLFQKLNADKLEFKTLQLLDPLKESDLLPENADLSRYRKNEQNEYSIKKHLRNHCFRAWSSCVITWDGVVVPCCYDKNAENKFGNLEENNLTEIWKSNAARTFLKKVLKDRKSIGICRNCIN